MSDFLRQRDLLAPDDLEGLDVEIVGAGAMGGAILMCLCKMGCGVSNTVTVSDHDLCAPHNLPTQWFGPGHAETRARKVDALAEAAQYLTDRTIRTVPERFTGTEKRRLGPVVILAVDSLSERARIWRGLEGRRDVELILDARMGAEVLEVLSCLPQKDAHTDWEESLARPEEGLEEPCTRRAIMDTVFAGAGLVCRIFRGWASGEEIPRHLLFDLRQLILVSGSIAAGDPGHRPDPPTWRSDRPRPSAA